jgi:hypothetical protein
MLKPASRYAGVRATQSTAIFGSVLVLTTGVIAATKIAKLMK